MPEWLIGALCSAPVWIVAALFLFSLFTVNSWTDEQPVWPEEDKNNDSDER